MEKTVEPIWYKDIALFLSPDNLIEFVPNSKMTFESQLNAGLRFALYFGVVVGILRHDFRLLLFPCFVALMIVIVYEHDSRAKHKREAYLNNMHLMRNRATNRMCMAPTRQNPFMNVMMSDYKKFPDRPPACNVNDRRVKAAVNSFTKNAFIRNDDDIFHRNTGLRQFYTAPVTTIPNAQNEYANWLYSTGRTCKEDTIKCTPK